MARNPFEGTPNTEKDPYDLSKEEIRELIDNPPAGYTLEDYHEAHPDSPLRIEGNPVGVEYTLTFGTGEGKNLTHGGMPRFDLLINKLRADGASKQEIQELVLQKERFVRMLEEYNRLTRYAHPNRYNKNPETAERAVAELRMFRKRHPWVYESISKEHERKKGPKKKFIIRKN